ncbi:hypothetical protein BV25DRAFT_1827295 [Artomyces pyxidatus]|uniref:Uncharacterized protein n=1 Tax=Artomyces pyxidatus TaxID=48021 RepID=A0ACB8SY51_9AGAM|nr:hypothetical protein BV25DRAFT_1827295 [Artomyces pyxidatus]
MVFSVESVNEDTAVSPLQVTPSLSPEPNEGIDLSKMDFHPWPTSFSAAVSKLLDDADIPNVLWGDLLYRWRGNRHMPQVCGFIVPSQQLETAVLVIERAGLASCDCENMMHFSDPRDQVWLPRHFRVAQPYGMTQTLFLCPSDALLDLIPLRPSDRNPADLEWDLYNIHLYDQYRPVLPLFLDVEMTSKEAHANFHAVKVLTTPSLIKLLILLVVFSPPERIGVGQPYSVILFLLALDGIEQGPYVLDSPSLQRAWDRRFVPGNFSDSLRRALWDGVRKEWKEKLSF